MKNKLLAGSSIGWTLCSIIIISSLFEINLVESRPYLWFLFAGVFIVFIPAIIYAKNNSKIITYEYENNTFPTSNRVPLIPFIENAPIWTLSIVGVSFLTVIFCFPKLFMLEGSPEIINGSYVLVNRGQILKQITESEFYSYKLTNIRAFFGMSMLFYSISILVYTRLIEWDENNLIENKSSR